MVRIELTVGKPVHVEADSVTAVAKEIDNAAPSWSEWDTDEGKVWINPAHVVSVREESDEIPGSVD